MRKFYLEWADHPIGQTPSDQFTQEGLPASLASPSAWFPLSWSHYVSLLSGGKPEARAFYESEAWRGGWNVRQLTRQIDTQFYERTLLSPNKAAMLTKGRKPHAEDTVTPEEEIKNPFVCVAREPILPSSAGRNGYGSMTSGSASTWSSSTAVFAA